MDSRPLHSTLRWQALLCAFCVAACVLLAWPVAETGMTDDFSYVYTSKVLAETGHLAFNGWGATMVGWQLLPAALAIKLFGFSFTVVRSTTLLIAMGTAFLLQRSMVRSGLNERNATAATLTLVLSPLALGITFNFLTDMWCLFALVFCFYACLRALQASTSRAAIVWIISAAIGNAFFGTVRQVAFLGVLVMVPSTLWLLRKNKDVLRAGIAACAAGYGMVFAALIWFSRQPYTVHIPLKPANLRTIPFHIPALFFRPALELPMLMLPVLLMFLPAVRQAGRRAKFAFAGSCVFFAAIALYLHFTNRLSNWLAPFIFRFGSILSPHGIFTTWPMIRFHNPVWPDIGLPESVRLLISIASVLGLLSLLVSFSLPERAESGATPPNSLSWHDLCVLVVPFLLAYLLALVPMLLGNGVLDRYLLPMVAMGLVLVVRRYQQTVSERLPAWSFVIIFLIAALAVPALHDVFSMYRATLAATQELQAAGVPRDHIDAGLEYDGETQIQADGFIEFAGVLLPPGVSKHGALKDNVCDTSIEFWLPDVHPEYSLSFQPNDCGGAAAFPPVLWHRWFSPHSVPVYIVKNPVIPDIHLCRMQHEKVDEKWEIHVQGCQYD